MIPALDHDRQPKFKVHHQYAGFSGMLGHTGLPVGRCPVDQVGL